jgi:PAS domain S-box-containing protein
VSTLRAAKVQERMTSRPLGDLEDFFEHGLLALHLLGPDGTILRANQAELDLLGYAAEEYIGRNITEFHVDPDVIADILSRLAAGEQIRNRPARLRCKDGSIRHVLIDSSVRFEDGGFMHTRCFTRDVTEEAHARHQAARAQQHLTFLAHASSVLTASLDYDGLLERVARLLVPEIADWAAVHVVGDDEAIRLAAIAHTDPNKEAFARAWLGRHPVSPRARYGIPVVIRSGEPFFRPHVAPEILERAARTAEELRALQALGLKSAIAVPLSARGRTFGTITVMTAESGRTFEPEDVPFLEEVARRTALAADNAQLYQMARRARADAEAAAEATQRLAAIVGGSEDAIIGKTLAGVITSWNPAAERMFGWSAAEAIGQHVKLIIPVERHAEEDHVIDMIRRGERVEHFDTVRITEDRRLIDVSLTVSPIKDASGRIIGASKSARDISERRQLEEERKKLLASERAARLDAEALSRAKDEFLATVSHELRTPLSGVFGWARMLQNNQLDDTSRQRAIDAIVRGAAAQSRLIEDLLDVSRIITGRLRLDLSPVDFGSTLESAIETVRPVAAAKGIELIVDIAGPAPTVLGAADRLQQIVWNLVMNAVKFTPRGGRVEARLRREGSDAEFVVADSGEGIEPELLPHVFDRFRQGDSSSTRAHPGLGLGLALVRHLIDLHGGSVSAQSPGKGQGATFTVRLPLAMGRETGS